MNALALCYHAVSPSWPASLSVTPEQFQRQVEFLEAKGYRGITFTDLVQAPSPGKVVAITFDDGYRSVLSHALPILKDVGFPATIFLPTDMIGGGPMSWPGIDQWLGGEHEHELMPLSWEETHELVEAEWEIGSHTRTHPHLTSLSDSSLAEELGGSKAECERRLGIPCPSIAYPYGDHDDRVVAATGKAGYLTAATLPSRSPSPSPLRWPRIGVYHEDSYGRFRIKVAPTVQRLRRSSTLAKLMRLAPRA